MDDDIVEISREKGTLKNKMGSYYKRCLEESEAKLLKHIDDEKGANLIMSRMNYQMEKP